MSTASVTVMKQGALDFLTKPVEPDVLLGAVRLRPVLHDARMAPDSASP
jgi:FixJ family two-component response regulator